MSALKEPPTRVFISYSHDSLDHAQRIKALSDRLRGEGIDCHLDQYETSPVEGWPRWMRNQIAQAKFVLVVCTETYMRRVEGNEEHGVGLGASWEGSIITQEIYDNQGKNAKFIPAVLVGGDKKFIPVFLKPFTHYDVSHDKEYERLYRHLTSQPKVIRPGLGDVRILPPETSGPIEAPTRSQRQEPDFRSLVLLVDEDRKGFFESTSIRNDGGRLHIDVRSGSTENAAFLAKLQSARHPKISVAFGTTGLLGQIESVSQAIQGTEEIWSLNIRADERNSSGRMEMAFNGISADHLAGMRARRILLNEKLPAAPAGDINNRMLELFVQGQGMPIQVKESPLPGLYAQTRGNPDAFIPAARLFAVLCLRLSGAVEHISRLDMSWGKKDHLLIDFKGQRARAYSNVAPAEIEVKGICPLA